MFGGPSGFSRCVMRCCIRQGIALGWTNPCKREKLRTIVASLSAVLLILVGLALSICGSGVDQGTNSSMLSFYW